MSRLLVASHRLPVTVSVDQDNVRVEPSSGGLASALAARHARGNMVWVGCAGNLHNATAEQQKEIARTLSERHTVPVDISPEELALYYDGFSNDVLWPLFHSFLDRVKVDAQADWEMYRTVNARFARTIADTMAPQDVVWIHDYQLALVPAMLRELVPDARIAFFLHVPFPSADLFRTLPWRVDLINGLLGADLVGFHTATYRYNFAMSAAHVLGVEPGVDALQVDERKVALGVFPVGVDIAEIESVAARDDVKARAQSLRESAAGKVIVLGVDRLDYTKGIPRRVLSLEKLFEADPALGSEIHFIQVTVPTRENVEAYAQLQRRVNELAGRVNAKYGKAESVPLHFLHRSVGIEELVALFLAADVMVVTPLRDGMNLVAKEYVAARTDERGALVLSEFAGAAAELPEALQVNPYDLEGTARAIRRAIQMPRREQEVRMSAMRAQVRARDVHAWADGVLSELARVTGDPPTHRPSTSTHDLRELLRETKSASSRLVLLDYDGTLAPFTAVPSLAIPSDTVISLLDKLSKFPATRVHVISGRDRNWVDRWLGNLTIGLHAEHGYVSRAPGEKTWHENRVASVAWKESARPIFQDLARRTPGAFVEEKPVSIGFHHRNTEPALAMERVRELRERVAAVVPRDEVSLVDEGKVFELRSREVHKGLVAAALAAQSTPEDAIIAAGNDQSDEDLFAVLTDAAITIRVGSGRSRARYRVDSPSTLLSLLQELCA